MMHTMMCIYMHVQVLALLVRCVAVAVVVAVAVSLAVSVCLSLSVSLSLSVCLSVCLSVHTCVVLAQLKIYTYDTAGRNSRKRLALVLVYIHVL